MYNGLSIKSSYDAITATDTTVRYFSQCVISGILLNSATQTDSEPFIKMT